MSYTAVLSMHASRLVTTLQTKSVPQMFEDDEVEDDGATGEEDDLTESEFADEEDNFNIDDLLYSDEELC